MPNKDHVQVEYVGERDSGKNPFGRPFKSEMVKTSTGDYYRISSCLNREYDEWETLAFASTSDGANMNPSPVVACKGDNIPKCMAILADWLNGSGVRGEAPTAMQEFSWMDKDGASEAETLAWWDDGGGERILKELFVNADISNAEVAPDLVTGALMAIISALGGDTDALIRAAPPEVREVIESMGFEVADE